MSKTALLQYVEDQIQVKEFPAFKAGDTITITYNGWITSISAGSASFFNVAQQAREAAQTSEASPASSISTDITVLTEGALIIDVAGSGEDGSFTTTGGGMTELFNVITGTASGDEILTISNDPDYNFQPELLSTT